MIVPRKISVILHPKVTACNSSPNPTNSHPITRHQGRKQLNTVVLATPCTRSETQQGPRPLSGRAGGTVGCMDQVFTIQPGNHVRKRNASAAWRADGEHAPTPRTGRAEYPVCLPCCLLLYLANRAPMRSRVQVPIHILRIRSDITRPSHLILPTPYSNTVLWLQYVLFAKKQSNPVFTP